MRITWENFPGEQERLVPKVVIRLWVWVWDLVSVNLRILGLIQIFHLSVDFIFPKTELKTFLKAFKND